MSLGIPTMGRRKRILAAASMLKLDDRPSKNTVKHQALAPSSGQQLEGTITDFFLSKQASTRKSCITDFFATAQGLRPPKPGKPASIGVAGKENSLEQLRKGHR